MALFKWWWCYRHGPPGYQKHSIYCDATLRRPGTALDGEARLRGTSVYLMDRVIPMLPRRLCEELCSLQPGGPRLTFSVIWDLSPVRGCTP